jgi:hypothetical protein
MQAVKKQGYLATRSEQQDTEIDTPPPTQQATKYPYSGIRLPKSPENHLFSGI